MCCSLHGFGARLTRDSHYLGSTLKAVVEHIHGIVMAGGHRHPHAEKALEILVALVKKTPLPPVDGAWITQLLISAAGSMDDEKFILFMRLGARRKEEGATPDVETPIDVAGGTTDPPLHGGNVPSETPVAADTCFHKIISNLRACAQKEGGWQDEAVYGGLIAIADIPGLGSCLPESESLQTLSRAIEKGEDENERKPFRVRKAAYNVVSAARDGWLRSADLRKTLEDLDIPRKLHSVAIETDLPGCQRSFLEMMEILSEDRCWHPYLIKATDIWLPFHREEPGHVQSILIVVGELIGPRSEGSKPPLDESLKKLVEDEWARVPGRLVQDLTVDLLAPLAEITVRLQELLFTQSDKMAVLAVVEQVIPSLERRRDGGYEGPGEDIRNTIDQFIEALRSTRPSSVF